YAQNNVYSLSLRFQSISKYAINCETGVTYMDGFSKITDNSLRNSRINMDAKLIYKKGNINAELGYLIFYDKIVNQKYIRQSLKLKAEYTVKKLILSMEGNNVENIFGIFDNTAYNTRYSILSGITQITVLNEALNYMIFKLKYNF
ncbi:MAG: hypothetical protein LBS69_04450, partial [Prevotellaceae bacterium]|nr:hypothetical protein [Prevotellaceae bacterium]